MKRSVLMIALMAAILALIAYVAFDLYRASRHEVIGQFQEQQRLIASQVANQIEKHLAHDGRELQVLAGHHSVQCHDLRQMAQEMQVALEASGRKHHEHIFVYNEQGQIIQSSDGGAIGLDHSQQDFFIWARIPENRGKLTIYPRAAQSDTQPTPVLRTAFVLATPIYRPATEPTGRESSREFAGVVTMEVNLGELLADQLSQASRMGGALRIWFMDKDGTLLYHPEHTQIVRQNIQRTDSSCAACHQSLDHIKRALKAGEGITHYQLKHQPARLAAFAPIRYQNASWLAVVSAPYDVATAFIRYSGRKILLLVCLVALAVGGGSIALNRSYRLRLIAEEQARQWREKQVLHEQIRVSEERHRTLVENARDSIFTLAADGTIESLNPAFETITGWRRSEWLGKPFVSLVCPEGQPMAMDLFHRALKGENLPLFELQFRFQAGGLISLEFTVTPQVKDGKVVGVFGVGRDISERKRTEAALRASEERFHAFMNNSPMAAYIKDEQGRYTYVNRLFEQSFKVKRTEILGKTAFDFYPAAAAEQFQQSDLEVLASDQPKETAGTVATPDGKVREGLFLRFPIRGASGERFLGAVVVDITERKRLEEQCRQSQKMEAVGQLAGGVAHDFNNILTAILGYSELLAGELTEKNPLHHHAVEVRKAAQRAATLTRQLLAFSRKQTLQPKVLNLNDVVVDIDKMLRRVIGENIDLVAVRSAALGLVKADPSQLEQVIMNLVVNARDAMPHG